MSSEPPLYLGHCANVVLGVCNATLPLRGYRFLSIPPVWGEENAMGKTNPAQLGNSLCERGFFPLGFGCSKIARIRFLYFFF